MSDPQTDVEYNVRNTVTPEVFDHVLAEYRRRSELAVAGLRGFTGLYYDQRSQQQLDVWGVDPGKLRPVFVVIHGGYWRALSRHDTAFMAGALDAAGIATVTVDYGLAPDTSLEEIVRQVRAAVAWIHRNGAAHRLDPDRIVVGGSSAGGHLTGSIMTTGWQRDLGVPDNVVQAAIPISGLFDLRPLVDSFANEWLGLDLGRAESLSPIFQPPTGGLRAIVAVAEHDGIGFLDQSRRFHRMWAEHSASELLVIPNRNHYDVFLDLADPDSALFRGLVRVVQELSPA